MYSYDERLRAVELYVKLGKRSRATTDLPDFFGPLIPGNGFRLWLKDTTS